MYYKCDMERDSMLNIRLPTDVKDAARRAAEEDGRSLSGMVTRILADWLSERGYLNVHRPRTVAKEKR
jgi:hypothetical protein